MSGIFPFELRSPKLGRDVFVAPTAAVIGDVELGDASSVWFGAVLRGDVGSIRVGARTNVQDNATLHVTEGVADVTVGSDVTIGHGAVVHGCIIGDGCLIGMGSVLLDHCEIGAESVVAAGSLLPPRMKVPAGSFVRGSPAKIVRQVTEEERLWGVLGARHYVELARRYGKGLPSGR